MESDQDKIFSVVTVATAIFGWAATTLFHSPDECSSGENETGSSGDAQDNDDEGDEYDDDNRVRIGMHAQRWGPGIKPNDSHTRMARNGPELSRRQARLPRPVDRVTRDRRRPASVGSGARERAAKRVKLAATPEAARKAEIERPEWHPTLPSKAVRHREIPVSMRAVGESFEEFVQNIARDRNNATSDDALIERAVDHVERDFGSMLAPCGLSIVRADFRNDPPRAGIYEVLPPANKQIYLWKLGAVQVCPLTDEAVTKIGAPPIGKEQREGRVREWLATVRSASKRGAGNGPPEKKSATPMSTK